MEGRSGDPEGGLVSKGRHRPFSDNAGYTYHCWECVHAKDWITVPAQVLYIANCELTRKVVTKFDSPNNQCSHVGPECLYETKGGKL